MELIDKIFFNPNASFDPLSFVGVLLTVLVSIYIFRSETSLTLTKERHEKLIFPLFDLLEPFLYQKLNPDILNQALKIIEENKSLADGKLISIHYYCKNYPSDKNFALLSSYVDRNFDISCRKLKLKCRSLLYKLDRSQFRNKTALTLYIIKQLVISLLVIFIAFLCFILAGSVIWNIYNAATDMTQITILLIFALLATILTRQAR